MPSLFDFLSNGGAGLLGNFGGADFYNPQDEAEAARVAAAQRLQQLMLARKGGGTMSPQDPAVGQVDPFNFVMPGQAPAASPAVFPTGVETPPAPAPAAPMQTAPASLPMPQQQQEAPIAARPQPRAVEAPTPVPGLGDRLSAGLMGFANSGAPIPGIANLISGLVTGQRSDPGGVATQNQMLAAKAIYQGLIKTHSPEEARAIALASVTNPDVGRAVLPDLFGNKPSGMFKLGNMELPYKLENGQMKLLLPGGGTAGSLGDLIGLQQKLEAEGARTKASAEAVGKSQGEAQQALPMAIEQSNNLISEINALLTHKGKAMATGPVVGKVPAGFYPDQTDYITRLEQVKAALTSEGIRNMQGAGLRITQAEANMFAKAGGRLERSAGAQNVDAALREIKERLIRAQALSAQKAGAALPAAAQQQTMGTDPLGIR
jgi:hypothetical protein